MPTSHNQRLEGGPPPLLDGDRRLSLRDWVPRIVEEIVDGFSPRRVILFGSVARGDETSDSDVDLIVVFDQLDQAHRRALQGKLMAAVTAPVPFGIFVVDVAGPGPGPSSVRGRTSTACGTTRR